MVNSEPTIFIGSSKEGIDVAKAIELHLQDDALTTIWTDGVFRPGRGFLEDLTEAVEKFDFAILVLTSDDLLESRGQSYASPRDNVLFELGLFMGRIGRERTFILHEDKADLKLPSDLAGITRLTYRKQNSSTYKVSSPDIYKVSPPATRIINIVRALGRVDGRPIRVAGGAKHELSVGQVHWVHELKQRFQLSSCILDSAEATFLFWTNLHDELAEGEHNRYLVGYTTDADDISGHPDAFYFRHTGWKPDSGLIPQWVFRFYRIEADKGHNSIVFDDAPNRRGIHLITIRWSKNERFCELLLDAGRTLEVRRHPIDWTSWPRSSAEKYIHIGGWCSGWEAGLSRTCFTGIRFYDRLMLNEELRSLYESEKEGVEHLFSEKRQSAPAK
jgi:hypothetical protein